jgi:hypothetical protein
MTRRLRTHYARRQAAAVHPTPAPEVVAFIAAVLRQMDHAANLVVAFFRSVGLMGPTDATRPALPREFLLELGALLQVSEWQAAGVIDWYDADGLSIDDRIGQAIARLKDDPEAVAADRCGTEAMIDVLRIWTETCALDARGDLRRSSAKQESSLEMQLEYVIAAARQHGLRLRATPADLAHMQAKRLTEYKDIFLDDAVSGTRTKRPA